MQEKMNFQLIVWTKMDCYCKLCPISYISKRSPGRPGPEKTPADKHAHFESCEELRASRHLSVRDDAAFCRHTLPLMGAGKICICKPDLKIQDENESHIW